MERRSVSKCQYHMCDGSGWRIPGWHLYRPCYCAAGRAHRDAERAQEQARADEVTRTKRQPLRIEEPARKMRAQLDALKAVGR